ncbi:hypothetical protein BTJ40_13755 [Microbulbifer sp. A4B17]|uniref:hypothetical protein n=1 Tax=Microbulbifer sp. A4B17 TaxID=359370 RepID=UPI000D52D277|nr:hypothetical protein [Microbulbifer sp. A4B17]AWF81805.1 hypothetical protein BTJ40_13755 [Microbulbifer sp. A4B17]
MRPFIVLIISVTLGKLAYVFSPSLGNNVIVALLALLGVVPYLLMPIRSEFFKAQILQWAKQNDIGVLRLESRGFSKGRLFWRVSDAQSVFYVTSREVTYWVACGSWLLGSYSRKLIIYKEVGGALDLIAAFDGDSCQAE